MFFEAGNTLFCILQTFGTFKGEGAGDHANGESANFFGDLGHDRGCTGAGTTAKACGHKDHVRTLEGFI
ncbi:hypothetical protein SDC9_161086 [bioreactor metagenome]|uniref:Uncharacterized protein n=1 Tax=bioreactor metagenome TaxID=1076179 RepID=A0A645FIH5_9ZZZZ